MAIEPIPRVFIDSSVLIAGVLSAKGASRIILTLGAEGFIELLLTEEVVKESRLSIKKKYSDYKPKLETLYALLSELKRTIYKTPSSRAINKFTALIDDPDDRHILASAQQYKAEILVTLDRRHFFSDHLKQAPLNFKIQLPGEFLKSYRAAYEKQVK